MGVASDGQTSRSGCGRDHGLFRSGGIVLDPFLGSGTTIIAAERTGRICYGIELDPAYVDVVIRRWQNFTGLSAKHSSSGRTFDELEKEVRDERGQ